MADNVELLQHEINRFGVVTVTDAVMYDILTGAPVLKLDTLKISNISSESQNKQIKGGQSADMLLYYAYGRSVNVEFQDALISDKSMRELWGAELTATAFDLHKVDRLEVVDGKVNLTYTPKTPADIIVLNITTGLEIAAANRSLSGKALTINTGASAGDIIEVYYVYTSTEALGYTLIEHIEGLLIPDDTSKTVTLAHTPVAGAKFVAINVTKDTDVTAEALAALNGDDVEFLVGSTTVDFGDDIEFIYEYANGTASGYQPTEMILKSTSFPKTVKFVGTTFVLEQRTGQKVALELEIPKLKLDGAFTLTMEAEGDASVFDFKGMALINNKKELLKIRTIGYID